MSKIAILCLLLLTVSAQSTNTEALAQLEKLKDEFDAALSAFEDKEAAQICVALAGKADVTLLLKKLKVNEEFSALQKEVQAAAVGKAVGNLIGYCIDKVTTIAPIGRNHFAALLDPSKKVTEKEVEGILLYDKAIELSISGGRHSLSDDIEKLLQLIEKHKKTQEGNLEETFSKMQEALSAKRKLSDEITDFEQKQHTTLNATLLIILISSFCLCCCWIRYKKPKPEDDSKKNQEYELTGTPEEQEKKATSMKKLVDTLGLMDEEIIKMKEELASLKKR